jgi:hypothetical protein
MGRTATTGEFKDGSFKDKKFELGKLTFNFCRETYSIPE